MRFPALVAVALLCACGGHPGIPEGGTGGGDGGTAGGGGSSTGGGSGGGGAIGGGGGGDADAGVDAGPEAVTQVTSCAIPPLASPPAIAGRLGVVYATMDGQPLAFDIAWPDGGAALKPLVVLIHGGGWARGSRTDMDDEARRLAGIGYVAASLDYRLANAACDGGVGADGGICHPNLFPAQLEDVRCAVRYLKVHAAEYGIDTARIAALGTSAGGHLASVLGAMSDVPGIDGPCPITNVSPSVNAVVSYYGPEELRALDAGTPAQDAIVANWFGTSTPSAADLALASPRAHVDPGDPPFLMVHGTADPTAPYFGSVLMLGTLRDNGVPSTLVSVPDAGHAFPVFSTDPLYLTGSCTTLAFLKERLQP